jgi:hypothetical protein
VAELRGKGWRVLGYFIWMLGAGVMLDSDALGAGGALLATGAGLFVLGTAQDLRGGSRL